MTLHVVTVEPDGSQFECSEDKNVLLGMEHLRVRGIQVGCRAGGCGVCRVQVLDGTYTAKRMSKAHVTADDLEHSVVLACRIFATSDLTVRVCLKGDEVLATAARNESV